MGEALSESVSSLLVVLGLWLHHSIFMQCSGCVCVCTHARVCVCMSTCVSKFPLCPRTPVILDSGPLSSGMISYLNYIYSESIFK